jgi:hypothetical protein
MNNKGNRGLIKRCKTILELDEIVTNKKPDGKY